MDWPPGTVSALEEADVQLTLAHACSLLRLYGRDISALIAHLTVGGAVAACESSD